MADAKNELDDLLAKRDELTSLLRAVRHSLAVNAQPAIEEHPFLGAESKSSWLWSEKFKGLNERGREKSIELFRRFATIKGTMGYFEFSAYLEAVGRPNELGPHIGGSQEAWRCYMFDTFGVNEHGSLDQDGFCKYRESIEITYPLEFDLLRAGVSVLPEQLMSWRRLKAAFNRIVIESSIAGQEIMQKIPVGDFQLFAYDCGEVFPQAFCHEASGMHFQHNAVMAEIRLAYARKHRFGTQQTSTIDPEDREHFYGSGIAGWWFSGRPRVQLRSVEHRLIALRLGFIRRLRNASSVAASLTERLSTVCTRGLISAALINKVKQDLGRYTAIVEVGEAEDLDDGMSASFSLTHLDNPAQACAEAGLATGIGSALWLDFLVRQNTSDQVVSRAVGKVQSLLQEMVGGELDQTGSYHSLKVYRWKHEVDECIVLRVAIQFKPDTSIDQALRQLNVGTEAFSDLLPELSASVHLSHQLIDMLENDRFVLRDLCVGGNGAALFARRVASAFAQELLYLAEDEEGTSKLERSERRAAHAMALERTASASDPHPTTTEPSLTGLAAEQRLDTDATIGTQSSTARLLRRLSWTLTSFAKATKACALEQRFPSLEECLFGSAWVAVLLPDWCTRQMAETPGALSSLWKETSSWFAEQMEMHWRRVTNYEKSASVWAMQAKALNDEKLRNLTDKERARLAFMEEKAALAAKLGKMGMGEEAKVESSGNSVDEDRKRKNAQIKSERLALETYEACWRALYAVHGVTLQTGTHKFALAFEGFDLLEVLPEPLPTPKIPSLKRPI